MKGLSFIEVLFQQVVKGKKDMTRRIADIPFAFDCKDHLDHEGKSFYGKPTKLSVNEENVVICKHCKQIGLFEIKSRYKKGEIVYLKEPYMVTEILKHNGKYYHTIQYKYTAGKRKVALDEKYVGKLNKWKSPRFMPEWASRYKVEILSVGIEHACDISEADCIREGVESIVPRLKAKSIKNDTPKMPLGYSNETFYRNYRGMKSIAKKQKYPQYLFNTAKESFISLWDEINGKRMMFVSNPYVFVYTFKLIK